VWEAEVGNRPVLVVLVDEAGAPGVAVLEIHAAGPAAPRRPACAVLADGEVLPLAVASSYPRVWEAIRVRPPHGIRPERVLADLAVRYVERPDVDAHQVLVADLADLGDHVDAERAQALGVTPLEFTPEPPTWSVWSYGLARSGARPPRLDLLRWRIALRGDDGEIAVVERHDDVGSTFYRSTEPT
jgi:hypothetical protein